MGRATPTPRPSNVPSFKYLSRTEFKTGECSAAQSIFLWPSGASAGSFTTDSCMSFSGLRCLALQQLFGRFHLFAAAPHKRADEDHDEERDKGQPDANAREGCAGDREDRAHGRAADAADPDQDVAHDLEPGCRDLFGLHDLR